MNLLNPILKFSKKLNKNGDLKIEKVREYNLYLSFLFFILYLFLNLTLHFFKINLYILIILSIISLFSLIFFNIYLSKTYKHAFLVSIFYSIFSSLLVSFVPNILYIILKDNPKIGMDINILFSLSFIISIITILSSFMYFIKGFIINNFYFKWILIFLLSTIIFVSIFLCFYTKNNNLNALFILLSSIILSLIYSFFSILYNESLRIVIDNIVDKEVLYNLSIINISLIYFIPFEIFPKRNNE